MLFFQDTRLPVRPGEQYGPEEIEGVEAERRQNRSLAIFWGIVAVPATLIALASFALALVMLFRLTFGRGAMVEFFVFGILGAVLLTPAYLFRQFWSRKRDLEEVLASQGGSPSAETGAQEDTVPPPTTQSETGSPNDGSS